MIDFTELLTASDAELVKIFYKIKSEPSQDFIKNINSVFRRWQDHSTTQCKISHH